MRFRSSTCLRAALMGGVLAVTGPSCPAFATIHLATSYQTIPSVTSVASARKLEVTGDGIPDLVVVGSSNAIWFHRGLAGGGYASAAPLISVASTVTLWDAGDINRDGRIDFVIADAGQMAWSVLGNGDGTFQQPRAFLSLFWGSCLELGDLDGDQFLDVVAAATYGPLYTMRGLGDGRFQLTSVMSPPPITPVDLAIADFDGDSISDVIALDTGSKALQFFRGLPGGLLTAPLATAMPGVPTSVKVGDLDEDGLPDAMVVNILSSGNVIAVVYGALGAAFGRLDLPASGVRGVGAFDLDDDGHSELVATESDLRGDRIVVFGRTAPRAYAALREYAGGVQPQSPVLTDANGDGRPDIVVCNSTLSRLVVLHGHGALDFGDGAEISTVFDLAGFDVGDVNGDHVPDVVTVQSGSTGVAGVHLGAGDGTFLPADATAGPAGCCGHEAASLVDLNADTLLDLVGLAGFYNNLEVVLGNGQGQFAPGSSRSLGSEPHGSMVFAEFNGDGLPDVAVACDAGVALCLGSSSGQLGAPTFLTGPAKFVATADFNRDGRPDLIASNSAEDYDFGSQISVYLNRGDGTFYRPPTFYGGYRPTTIAVGDVNGDGIADLAIGNYGDSSIAIFLGVGDGTFVAGGLVLSGRMGSLGLADLDRDGVLDLIATMPGFASVRVWPGAGNGTFQPPLAFGTRANPGVLRVTDLDGDGRQDLAIGHLYRNFVSVLLNRSSADPVSVVVSHVEVTVTAGHVRLVWHSVAPEIRLARVERFRRGEWQDVGAVHSAGPDNVTFEEDLPDGEYDYRLAVREGDEWIRAGNVHVTIRPGMELSIESCRWDGTASTFDFALSLLGGAPTRLRIVDVSGRIVADDRWTPTGSGIQTRAVATGSRVAPGVYWARVVQRNRVATRRILLID